MAVQTAFANRRLTAGKMEMEYKKPWDLLAKINANAGAGSTGEATNCVMWCLLDEVRTFYEENP